MAAIDPKGLFEGERLRRCSQTARLWWPYFYCLANGYGRIELDWKRIASNFWSFDEPISANHVEQCFSEYQEHHLLFRYESNRQQWGQWDTQHSFLPRHKRREDDSPEPDDSEYVPWLKEQHTKKWRDFHWDKDEKNPHDFGNSAEMSPQVRNVLVRGSGIGIGSGIGEGIGNEFNPTEAGMYLAHQLDLSGREMQWLCKDSVEKAMKKQEMPAKEAAEFIVAQWSLYQSLEGNFKVGVKRFLQESMFNHPEKWNAKPKQSVEDLVRGTDDEDFKELALRIGRSEGNEK